MAGRTGDLEITLEFVESLIGFPSADQKRFLKALRLLAQNEQHPSLRVHQMAGELEGIWSASASDALRITFLRAEAGRKILLRCSRHYDE